MLGIGLGAFADGIATGIDLRSHAEQKRSDQRLKKIGQEARADYDQRVDSGQDPGSFTKFWLDYYMPKTQAELILAGDVEGARALHRWGTSEAAIQGGNLFASSLVKSQNGDYVGAMEDVIQSAKVKGYLDNGFELIDGEILQNSVTGQTAGVAFRFKGADGKEYIKEIAIDELPMTLASFASPIAVHNANVAAKKEQAATAAKRTADREDFAFQEAEKARHRDPGHRKSYQEARDDLIRMGKIDDLTPDEEANRIIKEHLDGENAYVSEMQPTGITGGPAPGLGLNTANKVGQAGAGRTITPKTSVVDTVTGNPSEPAAGGQTQPVPQTTGITGNRPDAPGLMGQPPVPDAIREARQRVADGADARVERVKLLQMGFDEAAIGNLGR